MVAKVLVYSGEGASPRSLHSTLEALHASLKNVKIQAIGSKELLRATWQSDCKLLCLPGGADLPYCRALNGKGNELIREYVHHGGSYMGLCAGGYYACARIEFEIGWKSKGSENLHFSLDLAGERFIQDLHTKLKLVPEQQASQSRDYSNGGPAFLGAENYPEVAVLAFYKDGKGAAAVRCQVGSGAAVLCGTHPELAPRWLDPACDTAAMEQAHPELDPTEIASLVAAARRVQQTLQEDDVQRQIFWRMLLAEAGLQQYLLQC